MNPRASSSVSIFFFFAAFVLCVHDVSAFNITRLLGRYPEYAAFNDIITQTKLYEQINTRRTITVLAVNNAALSGLQGRPLDVVKRIISIHVALDYFDAEKVEGLKGKSFILATLFQASGLATDQQGFLNVTKTSSGEVLFGSAVKGAAVESKFVGAVTAQPYNISVLQVSEPIIAPGIDAHGGNSTWIWKATAAAPTVADAPEAEAPVSDAPEESDAPADAPEGEAPDNDDIVPGPAPSDDEADDKEAAPPKSSSNRVAASGISVVVASVMGFLGIHVFSLT